MINLEGKPIQVISFDSNQTTWGTISRSSFVGYFNLITESAEFNSSNFIDLTEEGLYNYLAERYPDFKSEYSVEQFHALIMNELY